MQELPCPGTDPANHIYEAELIRVVDGDTLDLKVDLSREVDLGFYHKTVVGGSVTDRFRLDVVNTPEPRSSDPEERAKGKAATEFVERQLGSSPLLIVQSEKTGNFRRWLSHIWFHGENGWVHLNHLLFSTGHATLYKK